jgi:hypothetical protein
VADVTDAALEELVAYIARTEDSHELQAGLDVGRRIVGVVFGGDVGALSSADPTKDESILRLAERSGKGRTWLSDRARVSVQYERYDAPYRDQVSLTHHVILLRAPEIERNQLLRQAAVQELSTRELERLVAEMVGPAPKPEPNPRPTRLQALLRDEDKLLAAAERAAADPVKAAEMVREIESGEALLKRLRKALKGPRRRNGK